MFLAIALTAVLGASEPFVMPLMPPCGATSEPACRIPAGVDPATARLRLPDTGREAFWVEDDVFHVVARRSASSVSLCCGIQSAMERIGEEPDLWALSVRVEGVEAAVLDVMIIAEGGESLPPITETLQWRGPAAPPRAEVATVPAELLSMRRIDSHAFAEPRVIEIYRPVGDGPMPVIYLADGESTSMFAQTLHPLIARGDLPPVMIVGLHSGPADLAPGSDGSLIRHQEYLPGWAGETQPRFVAHDRFLVEEVLPLAEAMGASSRREDRAVAGYSNGAAWAMSMATDHPDLFGKVMALSFGWTDGGFMARIRATRYGDVWLGAGTLEPPFHNISSQAAQVLQPLADRVIFDSRVAGHTPIMWHDQFPSAALWLFGPEGGGVCGGLGRLGPHKAFQHRQRHRAVQQHPVVEGLQVEARPGLGLGP